MKTYNFFEGIIISEKEKESAKKFLTSKGVIKHILIKEHLLLRNNAQSIKYSIIASTYRYDKRLRVVLFKFISYIEEYYRGIILDHYYQNTEQSFWTKRIEVLLSKFGNDLNQALERLTFAELINQLRKIPLYTLDNGLPK